VIVMKADAAGRGATTRAPPPSQPLRTRPLPAHSL